MRDEDMLGPVDGRHPDVADLLKVPLQSTVKSLVLATDEINERDEIVKTTVWLLLVRGDHDMNEVKVGKVPGLNMGFRFATVPEIEAHFGCKPGYLGPIGLKQPVRIVAGAGKDGSLSQESIDRALGTIGIFSHFCAASGLSGNEIVAVATSAIREAPNAAELIDAARIDGASDFTTFVRIVFPLVKQSAAALLILMFIFRYDDLLWPLVPCGAGCRSVRWGCMRGVITLVRTKQRLPVQSGLTDIR